jgi:predicted nuclease of predicted toxin-antitoxin system
MKIIVDMNLSPSWVRVLQAHGWDSVHWSEVGEATASDHAVLNWAREHGYALLTRDLDFGTILAATQTHGPSVIQVRAQDVLPAHLEPLIVRAMREHEAEIEAGALVAVEESRSRVRILPLSR